MVNLILIAFIPVIIWENWRLIDVWRKRKRWSSLCSLSRLIHKKQRFQPLNDESPTRYRSSCVQCTDVGVRSFFQQHHLMTEANGWSPSDPDGLSGQKLKLLAAILVLPSCGFAIWSRVRFDLHLQKLWQLCSCPHDCCGLNSTCACWCPANAAQATTMDSLLRNPLRCIPSTCDAFSFIRSKIHERDVIAWHAICILVTGPAPIVDKVTGHLKLF